MSHTTLHLAFKKLLVGSLALTAATTALTACQDSPAPLGPEIGDARGAKGGNGGKPGSTETVLFTGSKDGNMDIYAMNPDGSNVRRLTTDPASDAAPDFAPDNRKFVFVRYGATGPAELWTATADGGRQTQLTSLGTSIVQPRYSPDGSKIAFAATVPDSGGYEIFVINADGSGLTRLTYSAADERSPTWSPNGSEIAFESNRSGLPSVYVMTSGGLNVRTLVQCYQQGCGSPAFSPDGTKIAVTDIGNHGVFAVFLAQQLSMSVGPTFNAGEAMSPTWSKDGTHVIFASSRGIEGTFELYSGVPGDFDPASVRRLTVFSPGDAQTPAYSH